MKSFKEYVTMNEAATITLPKAKNDQEIHDRLKLLKDAGIEAQSGGRSAHTDINVSSKDVAKAKKLLGLNEAKDNLLTPAEIKKLKTHYDGNPGLRSISQSIKDFEADHEAFVKLKGNVHKSIKDDMTKTSLRLRKMGIEDGALTEAQNYTVKVEVRDARKANDLARDSYRGLYKNDGSDVFVFKKESDKEDFENDLLDMELTVLKESALTFDRVTPLDSKGRKAITYKDSEGRESYPVEFSPKMINEKKLVEAVRKILG